MKSISKFFKTIHDLMPFAIKPAVKQNRGEFILMVVSSLIQSTLLGLNVIIQAYFFQTINEYINGGMLSTAILGAVLFVSLLIFGQVINAVVNYSINKFISLAGKTAENGIMSKVKKLKPIYFENPENLLKLTRARAGGPDAMLFTGLAAMVVSGYLPYFIIMIWYMSSKNASLALIFPILFLPALIGYIFKMKIVVKLKNEETKITRVRDEYRSYIIGSAAKEMRMGGFYNFLHDKYKTGWDEVKKVQKRANRKTFWIEFTLKIITAAAYSSVIYLILRATLMGDTNAGFLAATITSMEFMFGIMEELLQNAIAPLAERYGGIDFYVNMMREEEADNGTDMTPIESVKIRNLSFKYPNSERYAVKDVDLDLEKDKLIAVVGENGSGKSTLLKLVLGLFDTSEGEVKYFDERGGEIENPNLREKTSAIFQDFYRYKMQLDENIEISDLNKNDDFGLALEKAGLNSNLPIFPNGGNTVLSREFNGTDLSGGQWQRVAIARGVYRDRDIIAFDEPTAAIDPLEESALYNKLREISAGKISLLITHRIGSARIADEIVVMNNGKVSERGTHEELMRLKGEYYGMVEEQSKWYK